MQGALSVQDCKAVAHLTQLTSLELLWPLQAGTGSALYRSLGHLPQLTMVAAAEWTPEVLPVFASLLPHLTSVLGTWREPGRQSDTDSLTDPAAAASTAASHADPASSSCPQVQCLITAGYVPFEHFPNITICSLRGSIKPSALASMSQHCTQLQVLDVNTAGTQQPPGLFGWYSLLPEAPCGDRVTALHGLARMPKALDTCVWALCDDAEMMALVVADRNVPDVCVNVPPGSAVTTGGLMQLGGLRMVNLELGLLGISFQNWHRLQQECCWAVCTTRRVWGCMLQQISNGMFLPRLGLGWASSI